MFQWNTWGFHGRDESLNTRVWSNILELVAYRDPKPRVLIFEEVCEVPADAAWPDLQDMGYQSYVSYYLDDNVQDQSCGRFGNAIMSTFPLNGPVSQVRSGRYLAQSDQIRTWMCPSLGGASLSFRYCATHIDADRAIGDTQISAFRGVIAGAAVGAGDFNLEPPNGLESFYSAGFVEGGGGPPIDDTPTFKVDCQFDPDVPCSEQTGAEAKIDYIWLNEFLFDVELPLRVRGPLASDHYPYEAFVV